MTDDMFSRYREEVTLGPEARARTLRKLQERFERGEVPVPETSLLPPQLAHVRGFWSVPASWAAVVLGLSVGAVIWANVDATRLQPSAAGSPNVLGESRMASAPAARALAVPVEAPAPAQPVNPQRAGTDQDPMKPRPGPAKSSQLAARGVDGPQPGSTTTPTPTKRRSGARNASLSGEAAARARQSSDRDGSAVEASALDAPPLAAIVAPSGSSSLPPSAADVEPQQREMEEKATPERSEQARASETLTKEVQLLQAAQLALRAGDTQRSLAVLAEHTWAYPQGQLAEARDVARIIALCQAGNVAQSKLHAKRFLQQRPQSPYALRVRAGCSAMTDTARTPQ